ncbi:MAG: hypothetical protein AAF289_10835 [Cyanobacteria bacterium P01_A01_bin.135]
MQAAGGDWVAERLAEIEGIPEAYEKANALVDLAADMVLSRRDILQEAFDTAFSIEDEKAKASTLGEILSYLGEIPSELVEQARTIIERLPSGAGRSRALGAVASHLPEPERLVLLKRALNDLQVNEEGLLQIRALDTIAPQLSVDTPDLLRQALDIIGAVQDGDFPAYFVKSMALRAVAPQLREAPPEYLQQALEIVDNVQIESNKVEVLTEVAPQLSAAFPEGLGTALDIVSGIQGEYYRAKALATIAPCLEGTNSELIRQAFNLAQNIQTDRLFRIEALSAILSQLDEGDRLATLQQLPIIVQEINDESDRVKALCTIAPHLNQSDRLGKLQWAFDLAQRIEDDFKRAKALCTVAPCLRESERLGALHQGIDQGYFILKMRLRMSRPNLHLRSA